ncbi:Homeobox protein abdominal-A-like protein, partial [Zootermopsis nevadensis]
MPLAVRNCLQHTTKSGEKNNDALLQPLAILPTGSILKRGENKSSIGELRLREYVSLEITDKNSAKECVSTRLNLETCQDQKAGEGAMSSKFLLDSMLPKYHHQLYQHHQQQLLASSNPSAASALFSTSPSPSTCTPISDNNSLGNSGSAVNYSSSIGTQHSPSSASSSPQHTSSSTSPGIVSSAAVSSRMYPYVSAAAVHHHHQQQQAVAAAAFAGAAAASGSMVPGAFSSSAASSAALASCRYTAGLTGNVPTPDSMVNYTLGHHHQNGAAASAVSAASTASAASASMAAAAQFYHQAAAASAAADPLSSCSQPGAASAGQPIPDIPRYPWMSITEDVIKYATLYQKKRFIHIIALCSLVEFYQHFSCLDDGNSKHISNVSKHLPNYTAPQLRRPTSSYQLPWEPEIPRDWMSPFDRVVCEGTGLTLFSDWDTKCTTGLRLPAGQAVLHLSGPVITEVQPSRLKRHGHEVKHTPPFCSE